MIETICIKSFKSLESVDIDLGRINVFIGANGSGKSNLLEAIGVLSAAANGRVDAEALMRRGVRPGTPNHYGCAIKLNNEDFSKSEINLSAANKENSYQVSCTYICKSFKSTSGWKFDKESLKYKDNEILNRTDKMNPEAGLAALKIVDREKDDPASQFLSILQNYAIYSPLTPVLRSITQEQQPRFPIGLSGGGLDYAISNLFNFMCNKELNTDAYRDAYHDFLHLIEWAEDIFIIQGNPLELYFLDHYMDSKNNSLYMTDASEGALYVLFTMILAIHPEAPRFLAIDNADHGLNPRLAKSLFQRLCKWVLADPNPRQMLITTHNPLVLDGLLLQDDRVRLFAVDRTNRGCTSIKRVEINPDFFKREGSLSRAWVMGHLGGVPNV